MNINTHRLAVVCAPSWLESCGTIPFRIEDWENSMLVGPAAQTHLSLSPGSTEIRPKLAGNTGNLLPLDDCAVDVKISERGRITVEREMQNIANARENQELVDLRGHDGKIRLGLMALGKSAMNDWSEKGLEVTEESILAAAEAFQGAFKKNLDENGSETAGAGIVLNRHQIVERSRSAAKLKFES